MAVSLPYDVIKAIEEAIPQREQAEKVVRAIEQSLCAIRKEAQERETVVKVQVEEAVKEGLKDELSTKEDLARLESRLESRIVRIEEALKHMATKEDLIHLESRMERRFLLLLVVMLAGFTIFNPGFQAFVKAIVALFK